MTKISQEDYESIDMRLRMLERMVNKLTKHSHEIERITTDEVVI